VLTYIEKEKFLILDHAGRVAQEGGVTGSRLTTGIQLGDKSLGESKPDIGYYILIMRLIRHEEGIRV